MNPHQALIEAADAFISIPIAYPAEMYPEFDKRLKALKSAISSAKAAEEGVETIHAVEPKIKRDPQPYVKTRGSGWFWCEMQNGEWIVCYINALWGAQLDGIYARADNFRDVIGPLIAPDSVISVREKEGL